MKPKDWIDFLTTFYFDLIGYMLPGFIFIIINIFLFDVSLSTISNIIFDNTFLLILTIIVSSYLIGHLLVESSHILRKRNMDNEIINRKEFIEFVGKDVIKQWEEHEISRNIIYQRGRALENNEDDNNLVYKFRFTANCCFASSLALIYFVVVLFALYVLFKFEYGTDKRFIVFSAVASLYSAYFLIKRGNKFLRRSISLPFSKAIKKTFSDDEEQINDEDQIGEEEQSSEG